MTRKKRYPLSIIHYPFRSGFTLIELLVAMAIIALLVMLGYGAYIRSQRRALDARRQGDMKAFQNGMEQAFSITGDYPDDDTAAGTEFPGDQLPVDPINNVTYSYVFGYDDPEAAGVDGYCACAALATFDGNSDGDACEYVAAHSDGTPRPYFCVNNLQ